MSRTENPRHSLLATCSRRYMLAAVSAGMVIVHAKLCDVPECHDARDSAAKPTELTHGMPQGLTRDNMRQDRYWNQMQRLGGTLSHLLKEVHFFRAPC